MAYSYPVIRWPWAVDATNNVVRVVQGPKNGSATIAADEYIWEFKVAAGGGGILDFAFALDTALDNALAAATIALDASVWLDGDGHIRITHDGTSPGDDFDIDFTVANSIEPEWLGLDPTDTTFTVTDGTGTRSTYQAWQQWHPGIFAFYSSDNVDKAIVFERRNLRGKPIRLVQSSENWYEFAVDFQRVASARMKDSRAAASDYADVADIAVDEPNTWENMWRYLIGPYGPFGDNRVYLYDDNTPSPTVNRLGPFEVILQESSPDFKGVGLREYRQGEGSEFFDVRLTLWKDGSS
jgi:hypothetical protein